MIARLKVIIKALPTWLAVVALAAPMVAEEAASVLPAPWSAHVTAVLLTVAAVAAAVVRTIQRVTPVLPAERGLLPKENA